MQKCIKYNYLSRELWLMYSGAAMLELSGKYGTLGELFESVSNNTPEGLNALYGAFLTLCEAGNAARRYFGYDAADKLPGSEELAAMSTVDDIGRMRGAVVAAISVGAGQENPCDCEEVDLGLEELNAKKKHG